jgi:hypothetical protein
MCIRDSTNPDRILDFRVTEGDEIIIVADNITLTQVQLVASGNNTLIRIGTNNPIGEVVGIAPAVLQQSVFVVPTTDAALRIG